MRRRHWDDILNELNKMIEVKDQKEAEPLMKEFIDKCSRLYKPKNILKSRVKNHTHTTQTSKLKR